MKNNISTIIEDQARRDTGMPPRLHQSDSKKPPVITEAHVDNDQSKWLRKCQEKGYWELI